MEGSLQGLQEMFSAADDAFSKSSSSGLKGSGKNPFDSASGPRRDTFDDAEDIGT